MKILLLSTAYNGLTQRAHLELDARGHEVHVELALGDDHVTDVVHRVRPELIVCPFLKSRVPESVWRNTRTVIIHPGVVGDRGPSSLDWAIMGGLERWGVTALEAAEEYDAGDVWATETFSMRAASKASLYRQEVTDAAIGCILRTIEKVEAGESPTPPATLGVEGRARPRMTQRDRAIDWQRDGAREVMRAVHAADGFPGVLARLCGLDVYLYGAHREDGYRGVAGEIVAQRDGAVCVATGDGAVWLSHLRRRGSRERRYLKLPAATVLGARLDAPERPLDAFADVAVDVTENASVASPRSTYREIRYREAEGVGYLHFDFHNGAMSTEQCRRLQRAFRTARSRPTQAIVLVGGEDFFSNGVHLTVIEAAADPVAESWRNINAIDDLILDIVTCTSHLTVSAVQGNAGAGGVVFAVACDYVVARSGRVFNPHYLTMGLHGSEYWTYLLPRRVGKVRAYELTRRCLPVSVDTALEIGLVDEVIDARGSGFFGRLETRLFDLCEPDTLPRRLEAKRASLPDAALLERHRATELARMRKDFLGSAYREARKAFVFSSPPDRTPAHLARPLDPDLAVA